VWSPKGTTLRVIRCPTLQVSQFLFPGQRSDTFLTDHVYSRRCMGIDKLIEDADIVRFIKAQRIKWLGHIQRVDQARPTGKLLDWKCMGTIPV
jgi:hypothetical protein